MSFKRAEVPTDIPNAHPWAGPSMALMHKISRMGWKAAIEHELGHPCWEHMCWVRTIAAWALGKEAQPPDVCCGSERTFACHYCQDRGILAYTSPSRFGGQVPYAKPCTSCGLGAEYAAVWDMRGPEGKFDILSRPRAEGGYKGNKGTKRERDDDEPPF